MKIKFNNMIKQVISVGTTDVDISSYFNVAYGIDQNFLYGCGVSIVSLLIHNKNINFSFHIFIDDSINDSDIVKFREICSQYNTWLTIYIIDSNSIKSLPTTKNWTHAIYFRFIVVEYFINKIDCLLYLDADVICNNVIDELIHLNLGNKIAAVVTERDKNWCKTRAEKLWSPSVAKGYFNSGVMYVNLIAWKENNVTNESIALLVDKSLAQRISYPDQDVLNKLLYDNVIHLSSVYNTQFNLNYELKKAFDYPVKESTIFIHYVGPTKPWHEWTCYDTAKPFLNAKNVSPWKNVPLLKAKSSNHLRYCAKHKINQRNFLSGLSIYLKYIWVKFTHLTKKLESYVIFRAK